MSTRRSFRFALPVFAAALLSAGAGFAITACSSSTDSGTPTTEDSGTDSGRIKVDASPPDEDTGAPPQTLDECIAACNTAHPTSTAKEDAIDTCWTTNCQGPCLDDPGTAFDAGPDGAADSGPDPLCGTKVTSGGSADCDNCTEAFCCTSWKGCFDDDDCTALDSCLGDCYAAQP